MAEGGKQKRRTGTNGARNPGRPPGPLRTNDERQTNTRNKNDNYQEKVKFVINTYNTIFREPEGRRWLLTILEKQRKSIENLQEFKLEEYNHSCGEYKITKMLTDGRRKRNGKTSKNAGTDNSLGDDKSKCLFWLDNWIKNMKTGTQSDPHIRGREEELPEAQGGERHAPADDYPLPRSPICGSQTGGFDCRTGPPHESCNIMVFLSKMQKEMQEGFQRMDDNMDTKIRMHVAAFLANSGLWPQTNAPTVSLSVPCHNPPGNNGRTNAAAGSPGGPIAQSSPQNEENDGTNEFLYVDSSPNLLDPGPETRTGDLADSSTTWATPLTVGAMNSSATEGAMGTSFERAEQLKRKREELDGNHRDKRPAAAYTTPSRPPIGGFMAEACQNDCQPAAAPATLGPLFSTNEGAQIQMTGAAHDKEASTSSQAPPQVELKTFPYDELGQGSIEELSSYDPLLPRIQDVPLDYSGWDTFYESWPPDPEMDTTAYWPDP